jgi:hypothetical protein
MEQMNTCEVCKNIVDSGVVVHDRCAKDARAFYVKILTLLRVANNTLAMMRKQYNGFQNIRDHAAHVTCDEKQTKMAQAGMSLANQTATELKIIIDAFSEIIKNYEGERKSGKKYGPYRKDQYGRIKKRRPGQRF